MDKGLATVERLPRYVRHRFRRPAFVVQPRDIEIVQTVAQHRVISSDDLRLLVDGSGQTILRRLQRLFHGGYLDRPRCQRQLGNRPMVYALGQRGAELLAVAPNTDPTVDWSEKNRQVGTQFLEHALMVSRFQAALRHAARAAGQVSIERWCPDGMIRESVNIDSHAGPERIPVAPDAMFTLRLLNEPKRSNRIHIFLEADRGTMTTKRFQTKMRGYWHYWRSGRQAQRFGIRNFLILTVTRTPERAANLLAASRSVSDRGLRMFLFGSERSYVGEPRQVLNQIWATPADQERHSILE